MTFSCCVLDVYVPPQIHLLRISPLRWGLWYFGALGHEDVALMGEISALLIETLETSLAPSTM